jgi:hypothetical protein
VSSLSIHCSNNEYGQPIATFNGFFGQIFTILWKLFWEKFGHKLFFNSKKEYFKIKNTTIVYSMKRRLRFCTFKIWILPNLVKYSYKWLPLEQHHKIKKEKTLFTLSSHNMWMVFSMKSKSFGKYEKGA